MSGCRLKLLCGAWVIRAFLASFVSRLGYHFGSAAVVIRRDCNGFGFIMGIMQWVLTGGWFPISTVIII